jgi:hypothetical protein
MIRLLMFIPCEKVLYAEADGKLKVAGNSSVISILESLTVRGEIEEELPANASLPVHWVAVLLWTRTEDIPEPVDFIARVEMFAPDGQTMIGGTVDFTVSNEYNNFRNTINFPAMPVGQAGQYLLKLSYKQKSAEVWEPAAEFPILIRHEIVHNPKKEV